MLNARKVLIADTSVLINFLNIDRMDLLELYPAEISITEEVVEEITHHYPEQRIRLTKAIQDNILSIIKVNEIEELTLFAKLKEDDRLGSGECSAIACASHRKFILAIDDKRAIRQAITIDETLEIIGTKEIMIKLIQHRNITISVADKIKKSWEVEFRFLIQVKSFQEIVTQYVK